MYNYQQIQAPPNHMSCLKTEIFSPVLPTVQTHLVTENAPFQKRSPEWRFLRTRAFCVRVDGRKQRFSNAMMSYICTSFTTSKTHARCEGWYRIPMFSVHIDVQKWFECASCAQVFFYKLSEKTLLKNVPIGVAGLQLSNNKFINGILGGGGGYTWPALDVKGIVTERRKHYTVL